MTRARQAEPEYPFDPEIERTCQRLRRRARELMADPPGRRNGNQFGNDFAEGNQGHIVQEGGLGQIQNRTVRDYLAEDLEGLNPGVVEPKIDADHFELKPVMFNMINTMGQFGGSATEDARQHLRSFMEICNSFKIHGVSADVLKLKLFPYSLRDRAKTWLNSQPPGSLRTWTELCRDFLARFNPTNVTDRLRNEITSFRQGDDESMYEAWERYRELLLKCPLHGFPTWTQVTMFYNAVNTPTRMMLDASANGTLLDRRPEEAIELLNRLAKNDYQFPSARRGGIRRHSTTRDYDSTDSITAQLANLTNLVMNMQNNRQEVKVVDLFCENCGGNHNFSECVQNPESSCYVGQYNRNNNTMSNTYNPAWKKHPNFSWSNPNNALNRPQQA